MMAADSSIVSTDGVGGVAREVKQRGMVLGRGKALGEPKLPPK